MGVIAWWRNEKRKKIKYGWVRKEKKKQQKKWQWGAQHGQIVQTENKQIKLRHDRNAYYWLDAGVWESESRGQSRSEMEKKTGRQRHGWTDEQMIGRPRQIGSCPLRLPGKSIASLCLHHSSQLLVHLLHSSPLHILSLLQAATQLDAG